ncbi:MAG: glutaredoxin [Myxococcales bacterium]|nr:glutaredoxin [Myxococcales bacterium]
MVPVRVYTTRICGYCFAAKRFLADRSIPFEEIDVTGDASKRQWLVETTGLRTVPQIFVGDHAIGGYEEMRALDARGGLEPLLRGEPAAATGA